MMAAVDSYLAVRRATGFTLSNTEYLLRSFAGFAADDAVLFIWAKPPCVLLAPVALLPVLAVSFALEVGAA